MSVAPVTKQSCFLGAQKTAESSDRSVSYGVSQAKVCDKDGLLDAAQNYRAEIKLAGAGFHALANYSEHVHYTALCYRTCIHSSSYTRLHAASGSPHTW